MLLSVLKYLKRSKIMSKYVCTVCQWVYNEAEEGKKFSELDEDWVCPICGVEKDMFELQD